MDEEKGKRIRGPLNSYATIAYTLNFFPRIYEDLNGRDLTVYKETGLWAVLSNHWIYCFNGFDEPVFSTCRNLSG